MNTDSKFLQIEEIFLIGCNCQIYIGIVATEEGCHHVLECWIELVSLEKKKRCKLMQIVELL